ncbi:MAG: hypothetical protein HYY16_07955 [Planctomycetes bacterium]|nr:hypothetical protein [Planctomycetota bacterium]
MASFSAKRVQAAAKETGFRAEVYEKAARLLDYLAAVAEHPHLKSRLTLRGGTAINLFLADEPPPLPPKTPKADVTDAMPGQSIDLIALAVRDGAVRCRILGTARELTLRSSDYWRIVPGEIATVRVKKCWSHARHPYVSGEIERTRLNAAELRLVPLRLSPEGLWEPSDYGWGPDDEIEEWAKPIVSRGPRPWFEMEQVLPGSDPNDPDSDPITDAVDLHHSGASADARKALMDLLAFLRAL